MKKIKTIHRLVAINLLNTVLLLLILNLVLGIGFSLKDAYQRRNKLAVTKFFNSDGSPVDNGKRLRGNLDWFDYDATKEVSQIEASEVLDDIYDLSQSGFIYQPWTQFSEPPFQGKRVSIGLDERGFAVRTTLNPVYDGSKPVINVFVLGGSTTFGYYVSDEHTWPTYLATALNAKAEREGLNIQVRVTNHGHATYFPSQETALCIDLFRSGQRPNLVIFMDGVNWGTSDDSPVFTLALERAFNSLQHGSKDIAGAHIRAWLVKWVPMFRLATSIMKRLPERPSADNSQEHLPESREMTASEDQSKFVQHITERFQQSNRISRKVCEEYGASAMFFLQPDAGYNYPVELLRSTPVNWQSRQNQRKVFYEQISKNPEFISLVEAFNAFGVQQGKKAVVNGMHYSPNFNRFLAETVAAHIDLKKLASSASSQLAIPTGAARQINYR